MSLRERMRYTALEIVRTFGGDWTALPFLVTATAGFVGAVLDFVFLQNMRFQVYALAGLFMLLVGMYLRTKARFELKKKAGFGSIVATAKLQIVQDHHLVTDGLYRHIRHPLYLGETLRNLGFVLVFSSVYGVLLAAASTVFLLFRIRNEEKMLVQVFGDEYRKYQRKTKKMIPHVY